MDKTLIDSIGTIVLFAGLLALSIIDWRTFRLPNPLTYGLIALGLIYGYFSGKIIESVAGAVTAYLVFVGIELAFRRFRGREGLGRGDAKLLAAGGAWCGVLALPYIVLVSSVAGIAGAIAMGATKDPDKAIPFGPFLAFGIAMVWGLQHTRLFS